MIVLEDISNKFRSLLENQYYIRVVKNPEKFIGKTSHRLTTKEQAVVCNSMEDARSLRRRFAIKNKFDTSDFEIVTGLDLYKEENPDELLEDTKTDNKKELTIYRGIVADNQDDAFKFIKSSKIKSSRTYGPGVYWTQDIDMAKQYGNYIFKSTIRPQMAKKILDAQEIVIVTPDVNRILTTDLVDRMDLGRNSEFTFYPKLWRDPEMVEEIQQKQHNYIEQTGGVFIEDIKEDKIPGQDQIISKAQKEVTDNVTNFLGNML